MKKTLFTALALASGLFMQTSLAEEAPALQPPTTALPNEIRLDMDKQGVVREYSVGFSVPYGKLSKVERIDALKGAEAVDATGKRVENTSSGGSSYGGSTAVDLSCGFRGLSPDTPYLDLHAKLNLGTGDAVVTGGPVSLDVKKDKEITLGGTTYSVSFDLDGNGNAELTFRPKGEAAELLSLTEEDEVTYMDRETSRSKKGGKAKDVKYSVWRSLGDEEVPEMEVRSYTLVNPHNIQVPLDYRVSTEPIYKVEFRLPEDGGLQPPLPVLRLTTFLESVLGWEEVSCYRLLLADKDLSFFPVSGRQGYCCGEETPTAPDIRIYAHVDEPVFSCKKPHLDRMKSMKVEVVVSSPDSYEGDVQEERTITAEVAKLGKMRLFVLKADGQPHEITHGEFTIRYTLASQGSVDEDGDEYRDFEYSCEGPDGDFGVCLLHNTYERESDSTEETDSSSGTTIRRTCAKKQIYKRGDKPFMLMLLPYTERRTITIPVSISGKPRNPFSPIPQGK